MNALRLVPVAAGGLALVALGMAFIGKKSRKSPDQKEKERRTRISMGGRITDSPEPKERVPAAIERFATSIP